MFSAPCPSCRGNFNDTSLPSLECHPCLRQLTVWPACNQLDKANAEIHKRNAWCDKFEWIVEFNIWLADSNEYREYRNEAKQTNQTLYPSPSPKTFGGVRIFHSVRSEEH